MTRQECIEWLRGKLLGSGVFYDARKTREFAEATAQLLEDQAEISALTELVKGFATDLSIKATETSEGIKIFACPHAEHYGVGVDFEVPLPAMRRMNPTDREMSDRIWKLLQDAGAETETFA